MVANGEPGVIYIGHLPHGFYENELKGFFSQFGEVLKVRVARSVKTFRPKGYAFVMFANREVAEIACSAMDGYFMYNKILVCKVVPPEKVHRKMFKRFVKIPWKKLEKTHRALPLTEARRKKLWSKQERRNKELEVKLKKLGVSFSLS
ncbi:Uncharacterized RNA-binding protein [Galdieria sulphuraria]|uniref:RNA-binding protein n=1 Tax=Galdieria sulphuraria TaxID=130081 RepID=M2Y4N0_GALSU|nr:RNA-binding protein [Galdieria sulphuraria]EME30804.1 RNA-binding protein [Galdieria sulphuraria]GJD08252.1 Uncharacterized RNA-binding protein [Galdieria sulphuraria]|eukprot:XP_005707324.1 RNA-binding protein [Galdieria sulphuraria]